MPPFLPRTFIILSCAAVLALGLGAASRPSHGWMLFCLALAWQLAWHLRHIARLERWLRNPSPNTVPEGEGPWDNLFALLYRHERGRIWRERELERTLARFRLAAQALTDGVVVLDADNRIQWCNETAERHLGLKFPGDAGQPVKHLVRQPEFIAFLEGGEYGQPFQMHSDRAGMLLAIQIVPYGDHEKLMQVRDVTQADRLNRMRQDFVANVSHELRTPLTVLSGFLETIRELRLEPEQRNHYLSLMAEQSRRMQSIVEDLLTLSSLESSPPPPADERVLVEPMLATLLADARALSAGRHEVELSADGAMDLLGADPELSSAFGNLVSNAVRYTPAGGRIRLEWRADADGAAFSVEDSGIGIPREHLPRLTERFYRVDRSRSRDTGGTGLGLAIVKHALTRHEAVLDVDSEPGRGSRFTARFPARRTVRALPRAPAATDHEYHGPAA